MATLITVLIITCIVLTVTCAGLAWRIWEDRQTIDWLARRLVNILTPREESSQPSRQLRAVDSGDVSGLPVPGGPDQ